MIWTQIWEWWSYVHCFFLKVVASEQGLDFLSLTRWKLQHGSGLLIVLVKLLLIEEHVGCAQATHGAVRHQPLPPSILWLLTWYLDISRVVEWCQQQQ